MADQWYYKTLRLAEATPGDLAISTENGHQPASTVLAQGLSDLANDGWELYAIIPSSFIKGVGKVVPTMIFRKLLPPTHHARL
jgi:hypothetical protein